MYRPTPCDGTPLAGAPSGRGFPKIAAKGLRGSDFGRGRELLPMMSLNSQVRGELERASGAEQALDERVLACFLLLRTLAGDTDGDDG